MGVLSAMTAETSAPETLRNVEVEAVLIGGLMCANDLIDRVADVVKPDDFYEPLFGRIYGLILREYALGHHVSPVTLKSFLSDDPALKELGGPGYLARLTGSGATVLACTDAARQVAAMARRRRLIEGLEIASAKARDMSVKDEDVIASADAALAPEDNGSGAIVEISAHDAFAEMLREGEEGEAGIGPSDIPSINQAMGLLRRHNLCILAGRPGMGKSAVAMSYAISVARAGHGVLFVSLEMSRTELMQRAAADMIFDGLSGVPYNAIRENRLSDNARQRVQACASELRNMPLHIIDAAALTIGRLNMLVRRRRRRMAARGVELKLVIVDYLQLVRPDQRTSGPVEAISEVSRGLKGIAKEHDLAVMALAQLNRDVEKRDDKRPKLSDLRDSGQIEQDADQVCFLYREHYYLKSSGPGKDKAAFEIALEDCQNDIDFICAKRRAGETKTTTGRFYGAFQAVRG